MTTNRRLHQFHCQLRRQSRYSQKVGQMVDEKRLMGHLVAHGRPGTGSRARRKSVYSTTSASRRVLSRRCDRAITEIRHRGVATEKQGGTQTSCSEGSDGFDYPAVVCDAMRWPGCKTRKSSSHSAAKSFRTSSGSPLKLLETPAVCFASLPPAP